jgi:molecular chaperone GrpE
MNELSHLGIFMDISYLYRRTAPREIPSWLEMFATPAYYRYIDSYKISEAARIACYKADSSGDQEKLKKAEAERGEYLAGWQRAKADLINLRKRDEEDRKNAVKFANEDLLSDVLPALDSFDMAFSNKAAWEKVDKNWRIGVEYIYSQLLSALDKYNLKQVNPTGQMFDPNLHIPLETVPVTDQASDGKITEVIQKGYELNGKMIRAPKVKVGEYTAS